MPFAAHELLLASLAEAKERSGALFEPRALARVLAVARALPAVVTSVGLEARLDAQDPRLDLGIGVAREHAALLAAVASGASEAFLRRWLAPHPELAAAVPFAWFEFDVQADAIDSSPWSAAFPFARLSDGEPGAASAAVLDQLFGAPGAADRGVSATPRQLFERLPHGARVLHVAALHHRGAREVRVQFAVATDGLFPWLEQWQRPSEHDQLLRGLLQGLGIQQVSAQLSAVDQRLQPHSVELYLGHRPERAATWQALFAALSTAGLAAREKLAALAAWPGSTTLRLPNEPALVRVNRWFHLTLKLGPRLEAKGYPYVAASYSLC